MDSSVLGITKVGKVDLPILDVPLCKQSCWVASTMFDRIIVERWVVYGGMAMCYSLGVTPDKRTEPS